MCILVRAWWLNRAMNTMECSTVACRHGTKPDGVCCVVGSLARGFPAEANRSSDLIYTDQDIEFDEAGRPKAQYFWEAFPAGSGPTDRTTYMFAYLDAGAHACVCMPPATCPSTSACWLLYQLDWCQLVHKE